MLKIAGATVQNYVDLATSRLVSACDFLNSRVN